LKTKSSFILLLIGLLFSLAPMPFYRVFSQHPWSGFYAVPLPFGLTFGPHASIFWIDFAILAMLFMTSGVIKNALETRGKDK